METAQCKHQAAQKSLSLAADVEECTFCHQQVRYSPDKFRTSRPIVIKLGRIGTKIVLPDPTHRLQLNSLDMEDLRAARGAPAEGPSAKTEKEPEKQLPSMRPEGQRARQKWYRRYRTAMISDLVTLGEDGFLQKWGEFGVKHSMLPRLKRDRYYKNLKEKMAEQIGEGIVPSPSPAGEKTPEMRPEETKARVVWYRKHKKAMIDDLISLGKDGFIEKWDKFGVKSRLISHLKTDPYYKKMIKEHPPSPAADSKPLHKKPGPKPKGAVSLKGPVSLPEWNESWPIPVKLKWLEVCEKLADRGGANGTR